MTKAELKAFRRKLVKARKDELVLNPGRCGSSVEQACFLNGIKLQKKIVYWLIDQGWHRRDKVAALFANSIAALDARIKEMP